MRCSACQREEFVITRFVRTAGWGLLWLAFGASAFATSFTIESQTVNIDGGGQFGAQLGTSPVQDLLVYCADFNNSVDFGLTFDANVGTLPTDLPDTRYGTTPEANFTYQDVPGTSTSLGDALARYTMAGWLITQYDLSPGANTGAQDVGIQNAIWDLLDATGATHNTATSGTWLANAVSWETTEAENPAALLAFQNSVTIITASNIADASIPGRYTVDNSTDQEMMMVSTVPETESLTLVSLGGTLLFLGSLRRRKNSPF